MITLWLVGLLTLPRKLLKEEFGDFLHLPRTSSHLAALPLWHRLRESNTRLSDGPAESESCHVYWRQA